ncbi:bone morphogenetic protein 7-like [Physella acuta]|uniref:bone morphogenetic protein 7-like n=1 Tax=Physella acuta TaxID=109671 RepID=UPI0027DE4723|nr:bone morphogenetic protein 7-like [Physella acuta]
MYSTCLALYILSTLVTWARSNTPSFFVDESRRQSIPVGRSQYRQREELQQELLHMLGLEDSKPKIKANDKTIKSVSDFMLDLYAKNAEPARLRNADQPVFESDMIKSFANSPRKGRHLRHQKERTFFFDIQISTGEYIKAAEFRIYKEISRELTNGTFTLNLYSLTLGEGSEGIKELQASLRVDWNTEGWIVMKATECAQLWSHFPHSNMGLYVELSKQEGLNYTLKDIGVIDSKGPSEKQAFLVAYMGVWQERRSRKKRQVTLTQSTTTPTPYIDSNGFSEFTQYKCQRKQFYLDFRSIGLDSKLIIAPEGYFSNFCAGECAYPMSAQLNATNHAIVQTLVHMLKPELVPRPCCAPTQYDSITMLYYDGMSVVMRKVKNMIVRSCGCQ